MSDGDRPEAVAPPIQGARGFLYQPRSEREQLAALAAASGCEGGWRPEILAVLPEREIHLDAMRLLGELGLEGERDLDAVEVALTENIEVVVDRIERALPEPTADVRLVGRGWLRLRRADWPRHREWAVEADEDLARLALVLLRHAEEEDLDVLELSERRPGLEVEGFWARVLERAPALTDLRPSPARRHARGLVALFAGDARRAEMELGAAVATGERRADRWLALARAQATRQKRPEPSRPSGPVDPAALMMALQQAEAAPKRRDWRLWALVVVIAVAGLLLLVLYRSVTEAMGTVRSRAEQAELP